MRCFGLKNWGSKGRVNVIGAILDDKLLNISIFNNNIDSDIFLAWIKELTKVIPEKSVLVLDNASFHKREEISLIIKDKDCILEFLPPYSPDLNPIEKKWAQAKKLRQKYLCTPYELFEKYMTN